MEHLLQYAEVEWKITKELVHDILNDFVLELKKVLHNGFQPLVYPGIHDLIKNLVSRDNVKLGLVTGNVREGARLKLTRAKLNTFFAIGGFGDDSNNRNDLPPLAIQRAQHHYNITFHRNDVWIIGDSIHDIICAKVNGLRSLAVATGWTEYEELQEAKKFPKRT